MTHPDGSFFTYEYDAGGNPIAVKESAAGAVVASFAYDGAGRRQSIAFAGASSSYGYDAVSRLQSLGHELAGPANDLTLTFGYNSASQIASRTSTNDAYAWTGAANASLGYSVNGLNQYTAVGGTAHGYDTNGNLISDGSTTYVYDAENRLVSASGAKNASLAYDPLGRLFEVSAGGAATRFLYDGDELVAEYDGAGNMLRRYVHGAGVDDPILWYEGAGLADRRSLLADHQGSLVAIGDASGNAIAVNRYDEYGVPASGNLGRFQYTGQAWLPELGLYHYKARLYSPTLGRFLQVDPIGYEDQVNLYAYVANDPVNKVDPDGMEAGCFYGPSLCGGRQPTSDEEQRRADVVETLGMVALTVVPGGPFARGAAWTGRAVLAWRAISGLERAIAAGGRLVLYSRAQMPTLTRATDFMINMRFGWTLKTNDRLIAAAIRAGRPIRDSFVDRAGNLRAAAPNSVLARERNQLTKAGWKYDPRTQEWKARNVCIGTRIASSNPCY